MFVNLQFGYGYDVNKGATPYSASQTAQHSHTPTILLPAGQSAYLTPSVGLQPSFCQA